MESNAVARHVDSTARKARLVAGAIRGKKVGEALNMLNLTIRKGVAREFAKILKSAVANMQSKHTDASIDVDTLKITGVRVDKGMTLKRVRPAAQGRINRRLKRYCHISIMISD